MLLQGETVPYVICVERDERGQEVPKDKGLAERAYHAEEMESNQGLAVDTEYYLGQQVFPVVSRLCIPIDGTDAGRLADCLGLEGSRYRQAAQAPAGAGREDADLAGAASLDEERCAGDTAGGGNGGGAGCGARILGCATSGPALPLLWRMCPPTGGSASQACLLTC